MKTIYSIGYILCLVQLLIWLFMPFAGVGGIFYMIVKHGFYVNSAPYSRSYTMAEVFGTSEEAFNVINRIIAIIYFSVLIFVVSSVFFWKNSAKKYMLTGCLGVLTICIWLVFPLLLAKFYS